MMGKHGEALELAIALLRAPALRGILRSRALPEGVDEVLAIASGSSSAVERVAGCDPDGQAELLEASRFFVQQILLFEGANAYRVLGCDPLASRETLRSHYLLLQRWLHPDRSDESDQWESALAIRINRAWQSLRTEAARTAYDATLPADVVDSVNAPSISPAVTIASPPIPEAKRAATAPVLVGLLGMTCLVLTWFALNREPAFDEYGDVVPGVVPGQQLAMAPPADAGTAVTVPLPDPRKVGTDSPVDVSTAATPERPLASRLVAMQPAIEGVAEPQRDASLPSAPGSLVAQSDAGAVGVPTARPWPADAPAPAGTTDEILATSAVPVAAAPASHPPATADADALTFHAVPELPATTVAAAGRSVAASPNDPLQLFLEAETTLRGVTTYLGALDAAAEPLWHNPTIGRHAAGIRNSLHARHGARSRTSLNLESPNWTLGDQSASVIGAYRLDSRRRTAETGVMRVELVRQGGEWQVSALHLESAK